MSEKHIRHPREGIGIHDGQGEWWEDFCLREGEERRGGEERDKGIYMARGLDVGQGEEGEEEEGKTGGKGICMARLPARKPFGRLGGQPHGRCDHAPTFYALLVVAWLVIVGSLLLLVARS